MQSFHICMGSSKLQELRNQINWMHLSGGWENAKNPKEEETFTAWMHFQSKSHQSFSLPQAYVFFMMGALWGVADAVWQTQINGKFTATLMFTNNLDFTATKPEDCAMCTQHTAHLTAHYYSYSGVQVIPTPHIFVISQPRNGWNLVSIQLHLLKMFGHTKFQLSITFTFRVIKLKVVVFSDFY